MFKFSMPTKKQLVAAAEFAALGFGIAFFETLSKQPQPFTKGSLMLAWGAGLGAVYGLVKGLVTGE